MNKQTVLVVEDDTNLLSGIKDILELEDYNVLTAGNGVQGLDLLSQNSARPPDLILSDITMPQMDGFTFLENVRKESRWVRIPFIFLTAKGERTDRHKGSLMGADVYLTKPFEAQDLLVAVEASLKRTKAISDATNEEVSDIKRKIMTIVNHEFRTPLTLIVAYAEMLKEFSTESMSMEEVMSFLHGVNSGADRLRRLVENFILTVELDSGDAAKTMAWRTRPITDMRPIIEDAHRQIALPATRPRDFMFNIEPDLPTLKGDAQFLTIALREMLDNAAKFSDDHSRIQVIVARNRDDIEISVTDEGRGIPSNELEKIWKPFYQIDREKHEDQGSGAGLAIVDGVVSLHKGTRYVESEVGKGSRFVLYLPCNI
jgi:two-component system, sensor histidine kinase and response regulator